MKLISILPWEYPDYVRESNKAGQWTSINKFLDLMVYMNRIYIDQAWKCFEEDKLVERTDRSLTKP